MNDKTAETNTRDTISQAIQSLAMAMEDTAEFQALILRKNRGSQFSYFFHGLFGSGNCQSLVKQRAISSA